MSLEATSSEGLQPPTGQPAPSTPEPAGAAPGVEMPTPSDTSQDPWAEAEQAYNLDYKNDDPFGLPNSVPQGQEQAKPAEPGNDGGQEQPDKKADGEPSDQGSEGDQPGNDAPSGETSNENLWSTDGLNIPDEYKGVVQDHLRKAQGLFTKKSQESKQYVESNTAMAQMIATVAADPSKLPAILQEYGKDLEANGLTVNWDALKSYGPAAPSNESDKPAQDEPKGPTLEEAKANFKDGVNSYLGEAKDDEDFQSRIGDLLWQVYNQSTDQMKEFGNKILKNQEELVDTKLDPINKDRAQTHKVNLWKNAIATAKTDESMPGIASVLDKDGGGGGELFDYIKSEPILYTMLLGINRNSNEAAKRGITPDKLIKTAYNMWSTPQRIKDAEERVRKETEDKFKGASEIPGSITNPTTSEAQDWDEIEAEMGDPFVGF